MNAKDIHVGDVIIGPSKCKYRVVGVNAGTSAQGGSNHVMAESINGGPDGSLSSRSVFADDALTAFSKAN